MVSDAAGADDAGSRAVVERLPPGLARIRVVNKIDLAARPERAVKPEAAKTGSGYRPKPVQGLDQLKQAIWDRAGWHPSGEGLFTARARHIAALAGSASAIWLTPRQQTGHLELYAEELRLAHEALCAITGEFTPDDLLGEIFSKFCIGK